MRCFPPERVKEIRARCSILPTACSMAMALQADPARAFGLYQHLLYEEDGDAAYNAAAMLLTGAACLATCVPVTN